MFPVHKKGDKRNADNYRGISALCATSKLFELAVMDPVFFFCKNLISDDQHAQQLDATFSAAAVLGLYTINLEDPSYDLKLVGSQRSVHRSHKVVWSRLDFGTATNPNGVIVGGCEGGVIQVYSASKLLSGENALMAQQVNHNGAVRSMDFNPYQNKLLVSGASESEIYIWDLNNTVASMTPGTKAQPGDSTKRRTNYCCARNAGRSLSHSVVPKSY
ncbi:hypothetical protein pipiens_015834 [Culex pipiens pipiens]|uniref:Vesicle associated protein n=1 Tax=Culex pipiens pipiens TaxID=38569 RepID=A0ABD1CNZ7_CULPP